MAINERPVDLAPPLLPTEQIGPKGWIRNMLIFQLADDYDFDGLAAMLRSSFRAFKNRTPVAGCEAVPLEGPQAGLLQLRHYGDEIEDFVVKDLRLSPSVESYAELEARGFPASALDPETMCLRGAGGEWPRAGDRLNVIMMQANFIRGGLILNSLVFHAYADGTTAYKFTEILAEEVRRAQGITIADPVEIPWEDRAKLLTPPACTPEQPDLSSSSDLSALSSSPGSSSTASGPLSSEASEASSPPSAANELGSPECHPEYTELPFTPQGVPPKLTQSGHLGHVFYFSPEKIKILKALAAPANTRINKDAASISHVSTNDVLTALLWRCVMTAQHPSDTAETAGPCVLGVALDGRRRAGVSVHKHTIGNIIGFAPVILDLPTLRKASLADLATSIRQSIARSGAPYMDSLAMRVRQLDDVNRLQPTVFLDMPGKHTLVSSWAEFPFYDIKWGPALGDHIRSVRVPASGVCHSFHVRLPDHPSKGGAEIFVGAMGPAMDRLLADPLWNEFAELPTAA